MIATHELLGFSAQPASSKTLGMHPTRQLEPGIYVDPAQPALYFARCVCDWEAAAITLGFAHADPRRRRGARGLLSAHDAECGRSETTRTAREKAREAAFGKKRA